MQIITMIASILALILATVALVVAIRDRKYMRSAFRIQRKSMMDYIKQENEALQKSVSAYADQKITAAQKDSEEKTRSSFLRCVAAIKNLNAKVSKQAERIGDLESGVIPDYDEARKAVDAVNDMNRGISGILGFDPIEALRKSRQEGD